MFDIKCLASGSSGNCYIVSDGETKLLLDAGVKLKRILQECDFDLQSISGALITHNHKDHSLAVPDLIDRDIKVYGTAGTVINHSGKANAICLRPYVKYGIGTMDVVAMPMEHDIPCYGFWIESLKTGDTMLYITDTKRVTEYMAGIGQMLVEANYHMDLLKQSGKPDRLKHRIMETHMAIETLERWLGYLDKSKLKEIYLCHLSDRHSDEEMFRGVVQAVAPNARVLVCGRNGGTT